MSYKTFTAGDILTAAQVNEFLMDQAVMAFPDSGARGSAITLPTDGMMSYLQDTNVIEQYRTSGTAVAAWEPVSPGLGNLLINGDFAINQRAFTSTTSGNYGFDRWLVGNSGGTVTYSAQTFTPGAAPVAGYEARNHARLVTSGQSAAGDYALICQRIEDVRTLAGQTATVSFWAKAASGTPKIAVEVEQNFGSGGSPSATVAIYAGQVTLTTSWARYYVSVAVPSITGKTIGTTANTSYVASNLFVSAGSDFNSRTGTLGVQTGTFDLWGVQVERGTVASPFRTATGTLQGELAACQRYYQVLASGNTNFVMAGHGYATTGGVFAYSFPVPFRSGTLTMTLSSASHFKTFLANGTDASITALTSTNLTSRNARIDITVASGLSVGQAVLLISQNASAFLAFSAEL